MYTNSLTDITIYLANPKAVNIILIQIFFLSLLRYVLSAALYQVNFFTLQFWYKPFCLNVVFTEHFVHIL